MLPPPPPPPPPPSPRQPVAMSDGQQTRHASPRAAPASSPLPDLVNPSSDLTPISARLENRITTELTNRFGSDQDQCKNIIVDIKQALIGKQRTFPELDAIFHLGHQPQNPAKQVLLFSSILDPQKLSLLLEVIQNDAGTSVSEAESDGNNQAVQSSLHPRQQRRGRQGQGGWRQGSTSGPANENLLVNDPRGGHPPQGSTNTPSAADAGLPSSPLPAAGSSPPPAAGGSSTPPATVTNNQMATVDPMPHAVTIPSSQPAANASRSLSPAAAAGDSSTPPDASATNNNQTATSVDPLATDNASTPLPNEPPVQDVPINPPSPLQDNHHAAVDNNQQAAVDNNQQAAVDNNQPYDGYEIHGLRREAFNRFIVRFKAVDDLRLKECICILRNTMHFDVQLAPLLALKEGVILYQVPPALNPNQDARVRDGGLDNFGWNIIRNYNRMVGGERVRYTKYQCLQGTNWKKKVYKISSVAGWVLVHYQNSGVVPVVDSMSTCVSSLRRSFTDFRDEDNTFCDQMQAVLG